MCPSTGGQRFGCCARWARRLIARKCFVSRVPREAQATPDDAGHGVSIAWARTFYTPDDKAIVTPNSDTPYYMIWMNISQEPIVL